MLIGPFGLTDPLVVIGLIGLMTPTGGGGGVTG
jgi:hypothetical protein